MDKTLFFILKGLRRIYEIGFGRNGKKILEIENNPDIASKEIYNVLISDEPAMIARFGGFELATLINYLGVKNKIRNIGSFIKGESPAWWWNNSLIKSMYNNAGFFPPSIKNIENFCELMLKDITQINILGSWLKDEYHFEQELVHAQKVQLLFLEPFWSKESWTNALAGKKVLVVHPFTDTIIEQYKKRQLLFTNNILPVFELKTLKAVQSIAGTKTEFSNWFEALEFMKNEINKIDFDICLIGAGAYGLPLAAHVKRMGKKGFHMGGSLQLLFGIWGKRWDNVNYGSEELGRSGAYRELYNEHWVKPGEKERPHNADNVENSCYW